MADASSLYAAHYRGFFSGLDRLRAELGRPRLGGARPGGEGAGRSQGDAGADARAARDVQPAGRSGGPAATRCSGRCPSWSRRAGTSPTWSGGPDGPTQDYPAFRAARPKQDLFLRLFAAAGGRVATGTDASNQLLIPGYSEHRELELLVGAGFSPRDALLAATRNGALLLGVDSLGILAPGKAADLVVLTRDPLGDIRNTLAIDRVMVARRAVLRRLDPKGLVGAWRSAGSSWPGSWSAAWLLVWAVGERRVTRPLGPARGGAGAAWRGEALLLALFAGALVREPGVGRAGGWSSSCVGAADGVAGALAGRRGARRARLSWPVRCSGLGAPPMSPTRARAAGTLLRRGCARRQGILARAALGDARCRTTRRSPRSWPRRCPPSSGRTAASCGGAVPTIWRGPRAARSRAAAPPIPRSRTLLAWLMRRQGQPGRLRRGLRQGPARAAASASTTSAASSRRRRRRCGWRRSPSQRQGVPGRAGGALRHQLPGAPRGAPGRPR